jgi:hypothetical protein
MKRIHHLSIAALVAGLPGLAFLTMQEPAAAEPGWEDAVTALYASISGPAGQERDWEAFQNQFTEEARMMVSIPTPEGPSRLLVLTPEDYVKRSGAMIVQNGFTEREIGRRAQRFGNVVQVFSAYEGRMKRDGKEEVMRGVNCIHLLRGTGGWKIANLLWEQESSDNPLPADLLQPASAGPR